ncbi:MAG: hypothetical protein JWP97_1909 [Labilithrix sp.]|nr:hypothetical protein [Labilithrix sp.]
MKSIRAFFWSAPLASVASLAAVSVAVVLVAGAGCVPSGSAPAYDAGATSSASSASFKPSANVMTTPFEDTFDRTEAVDLPEAGAATEPRVAEAGADAGDAGAEGGLALGKDAGAEPRRDPSNLGPNWILTKGSKDAWRVEGGKLCVQNAHNHGVWLNRTLPVNARIEFDATPFSDDGDLKAEVWGDGVSYATGTSYTNATSYLAILGGWKNTLQVLARLNEHAADRREIKIDKDSDDARQRPVQKGQTYHFKIERTDGKTVRWSVDGVEFFTWTDDKPLAGQGHDHFGFNEWEVKVCFDNVKVTPL